MEKLIKELWVIEGILSEVWLQIRVMPHIWNSEMRMQKYFNMSIREVYLLLLIQCFYMENKCFQRRNKFSISWKTPVIQNSKGVLAIGINKDIKWIPEADFQEARAKRRKDRRIKRETNLRKICSFVLNFCHRKLSNEGLKTKQNTKKTRVRKVLQGRNYWHRGQYKWKDPNLVVGGGRGLGTACRGQIQGKKKKNNSK